MVPQMKSNEPLRNDLTKDPAPVRLTPADLGIGLLFDAIREAVIAADATTGRIVLWNPAAQAIFGYSADEAIGMLIEDLMPDEMRENHRRGLAKYAATGQGALIDSHQLLDLPAVTKDERPISIEMTLSPLSDPRQQGARYALAIIRDVTERRRSGEATEAALKREQEATDRLRALDEMKNSFLTAVSHDIRTPLAVILGLGVLLQREDELSVEQRKEFITKLVESARRLETLLTDLLDVDRLSRGTLDIHPRPVNLGLLAKQVAEETYLEKHNLKLQYEPVMAFADPARVERIIENLITNAGKHTPSGTEILLSVKREGDGVLISVDDSGPGIPDAHKLEIFLPFNRIDQNDPNPGPGLGLAMVDRFAKLHGGKAWVEDRPGGGAAFRVFLPRALPEERRA